MPLQSVFCSSVIVLFRQRLNLQLQLTGNPLPKPISLYDTKPSSEPMWSYYQLDPWKQTSVKF